MDLVQGYAKAPFQRVRDVFAASLSTPGPDGELGAAVSIWVDGQCAVDLYGGWRNFEQTVPWTSDTLAGANSAAKGFCALVIHMLADRGVIKLDAPIAQYWPEFAANGKSTVTLMDVLTHTQVRQCV